MTSQNTNVNQTSAGEGDRAAATEPLLRVESLRKSFDGREVLRDVDLEVMPGEVVTIIGPSGSGKSTLLRCMNLLESPDDGHVWFSGRDLCAEHVDVNRLRERIGMVFQGFNLFENMDVLGNCTLAPVTLRRMARPDAERVAMGHLESVGLADFAHAPVSRLSGGQKQRVAIARALACEPEVILCDEATSALDPKSTNTILKLLRDINRETGVTLVVITHSMDVVEKICDNVAVLEHGRVVEQGSVAKVFAEPQAEATRVLLGKVDWDA